MLLCSKLISN